MSESATPATQNGSTTCVETFEKERFCNFPHRHGEATGKPEEKGAPKRACRARPLPSFTFWNFKIDVFLRFSLEPEFWTYEASVNFHHIAQNTTHATEFAPCRYLTQPCQCDVQKTQHDTFKVLRLPRKMTMDTSKVLRLPRKMQDILWKRRESIGPATQNGFRHVPVLGVEETEFCRQVKWYFLAYNMEFKYRFYYLFWQRSYVST